MILKVPLILPEMIQRKQILATLGRCVRVFAKICMPKFQSHQPLRERGYYLTVLSQDRLMAFAPKQLEPGSAAMPPTHQIILRRGRYLMSLLNFKGFPFSIAMTLS